MLPATLLNWLVEWVRKQFQEYLKTSIHSLYVNSRRPLPLAETVPIAVPETAKPTPCLVINRKQTTQQLKRSNIISSAIFLSKKDQSRTREQRLSL
jgi:hypothetical protein